MWNLFKRGPSWPEIMRERYRKEDQEKFERRMDAIKRIANENMKQCESHRRGPHELYSVVPYEDLLRIWDIADRAKWNTYVG